MDINNNLYEIPLFFTSNIIEASGLVTELSGRLLKCCMTQVAGMLKASVEKQRKRLFSLGDLKKQGKAKSSFKQLILKIKQNIPQKPNALWMNMELNSICCDFKATDKEFDGFIKLKSIITTKVELAIPIKFSRHSLDLASKGEMMNSFLFRNECVDIRWEIEKPELRKKGILLGCDQGLKTVLTCSNKMETPNKDKHGLASASN